MTDKQKLVYKAVKTFGPETPHKIALRMGYKESAPISQVLIRLNKMGLLTKTGKGKLTKYQINE